MPARGSISQRPRRRLDLRQQVADPPADRVRVEIRPEDDPLGAELAGEILDEVEVVGQARVEADVGRDLGDEEAFAGRLERAEGVEGEHLRVGNRACEDRELPERFLWCLVHRVDHRKQAQLGHLRHVREDETTVEGDALEAGVEADAGQTELVFAAVELGQARVAVGGLYDADGGGEARG